MESMIWLAFCLSSRALFTEARTPVTVTVSVDASCPRAVPAVAKAIANADAVPRSSFLCMMNPL
jgi:hypothetical protein